jgi:RNA polymerase sigma-70 factor, ECF subfamily
MERIEPIAGRTELHAAYARNAAPLFRYALILLTHHHEAEDAVQQVFASLTTRGVAGIDSLDRYLRTSVRNECYSALQRRKGQPIADGMPLLEALPAAEVRTDDRLALEQGLRTLPPEQREVIHLKVFEGCSFQEIADQTNESINTVASRYRYAIQKLRVAFGAGAERT